jgi:cytochrome c peroxidase
MSLGRSIALVLLFAGCTPEGPSTPDLGPRPPRRQVTAVPPSAQINPRLLRRFQRLQDEMDGSAGPPAAELVDLGHQLYFDARLSADQTVSCASCHPLDDGGTIHEPTAVGIHGRRGTRNAPTVLNAAGQFAQFWDGRASDVESQAEGPLLNPDEMGMTPAGVVAVLSSIPGYTIEFAQAFPGEPAPITLANLGRALGAFERVLVTPSVWDRFLAGDDTALTTREREGLRLFANLGCVECHTGEYLGGSMFKRVGLREPWPDQRDQGRAAISHQPDDRMVFKVPSLRNIAITAPYFHDGSAATLPEAVRMMGRYQLGISLDAEQTELLVAWLETLTGKVAPELAAPPVLPADGPETGKLAAR